MNIRSLTLPHTIIFDWDNTLADSWGTITEAINTTRSAFGMDTWTIIEAKKLCTLAARDSFPQWFGTDSKRALDIFFSTYNKTHLDNIKPLPGADELLRWMKAEKIHAFIVSNKRGDTLRREVVHLGWADLFEAVVGSMDAQRDKPERDPVDLALKHVGLRANDPNIWFVGDTHADVECARNSGCTPVLIHNNADAEKLNVDLVFSDCIELKSLLYNEANKNNKFRERS